MPKSHEETMQDIFKKQGVKNITEYDKLRAKKRGFSSVYEMKVDELKRKRIQMCQLLGEIRKKCKYSDIKSELVLLKKHFKCEEINELTKLK
jgi:uncharacterized protein (DUF2461 family)